MLLSIVLFMVLVQIIDFLLIELPTILFAVWREKKQTRKYQGDYLVQKPTLTWKVSKSLFLQLPIMLILQTYSQVVVHEKGFFWHFSQNCTH
jgi:hypothetical protein